MSLNIFWFIPTFGDSRYLGSTQGTRALDYDYLKQIGVAADTLGYDGVLIPTGRSCEDPWIVASSLVGVTTQTEVPGGAASRPAATRRGGAHDGHAGPIVRRARCGQSGGRWR